MIAIIQAELRKLLTVRSTYITTGLGLLLISFIAFYALGYKSGNGFPSFGVQQAIVATVSTMSIFAGIIAVLHICHEYRYNTIAYTLTITNNRLKVLFAKLLVIGAYAVAVTLLTLILTIGLTTLGVQISGHDVGPQDLAMSSILWKALVYGVGSAWLGLTFGFLFRNLVFTLVAYFILPTTVEPLLRGLLKVEGNYLPFTLLNQVLSGGASPDTFSPLASAGMFGLYLLGALIVAAVLLLRRDAN